MTTPTRRLDGLAVAAIAMAAAVLLAVALIGHPVPLYGVETDLLGDSVPAARALGAGRITPDTFQFRGPGYPLLLAGAWRLVGDAFLAARLLNVAAAAAAAAAAYLLLRGTLGPAVGLASVLALLANPVFIRAAIEAGTDMPALAFSLVATWLVLRGGGGPSVAAAGLAAGYACVTRYNAVFLVPAALLALWIRDRSPRQLLVWAAGFLVPVGAWVAWHVAVTGQPPRNQNFLNVAYEVYGGGVGWDRFWVDAGAPFGSFLDVVRYDPLRFVQHVGRNLVTRWVTDAHQLMPVWIGALSVPGMIVAWRSRPARLGLAVHFLLAYLVLTVVFYTPRFFLYLLPFYLSGTFALLLRPHAAPAVAAPGPSGHASRARLAVAALGAALILASAADTVLRTRRLLRDPPIETRAGGEALRVVARPGQRVMARKPHVAYYAGLDYVPLPYRDAFVDFLAEVRRTRADYLFISPAETGLQPQLAVLADPGVAIPGLVPLAHRVLSGSSYYALYRITPEEVPAAVVQDSLLEAIRRFAARRPGQEWPLTYLGGHLVTMGRFREAIGPLAEAARMAPADPMVARFQALAHGETGDLEGAAAACERALRSSPDGAWARGYLGHLRLLQGRYGEARAELELALRAEPANASLLAEYLEACALGGYWNDAAAAAEQVLRANPGHARARLLGARALLRLGRPDRALALLEPAGAISGPDSARVVAFADSVRRGLVSPAP